MNKLLNNNKKSDSSGDCQGSLLFAVDCCFLYLRLFLEEVVNLQPLCLQGDILKG